MDCADKIKEIRKMTGLNRKEFCKAYQIPYQTVTDWELGHRSTPEYVVRMLEFYVHSQMSDEQKMSREL